MISASTLSIQIPIVGTGSIAAAPLPRLEPVAASDIVLTVSRHVGRRMRLRRELLGMSMTELGRRMGGLTYQQVSNYETGTSHMTIGRLVQASRAMAAPLDFFFSGMDAQQIARCGLDGPLVTNRPGDSDPSLTATDIETIRRLRNLPPSVRRAIEEVIAAAVERQEAQAETDCQDTAA